MHSNSLSLRFPGELDTITLIRFETALCVVLLRRQLGFRCLGTWTLPITLFLLSCSLLGMQCAVLLWGTDDSFLIFCQIIGLVIRRDEHATFLEHIYFRLYIYIYDYFICDAFRHVELIILSDKDSQHSAHIIMTSNFIDFLFFCSDRKRENFHSVYLLIIFMIIYV